MPLYSLASVVPAFPDMEVSQAPNAPRKLYPEGVVRAEPAGLHDLHHNHRARHLDDLSRLHLTGQLDHLLSGYPLEAHPGLAPRKLREDALSVVHEGTPTLI